jgi:hypothetical protein
MRDYVLNPEFFNPEGMKLLYNESDVFPNPEGVV